MISVDVDQAQIDDIYEQLAYLKNGAPRAISRALNKTANKAKTIASREIRDQVNLPAAYVRERLKSPASGFAYAANINRLTAKISTPQRGILLAEFLASPALRAGKPATPILVKIKKGSSGVMLYSGFFVRTRGSAVLTPAVSNDVLRRLEMKRKLDSGPFTVLHGPSLSQVFTTVKDEISAGLTAVLAANLQREMGWLLKKYPPPNGDGSTEE